jgi:hypothetical protein
MKNAIETRAKYIARGCLLLEGTSKSIGKRPSGWNLFLNDEPQPSSIIAGQTRPEEFCNRGLMPIHKHLAAMWATAYIVRDSGSITGGRLPFHSLAKKSYIRAIAMKSTCDDDHLQMCTHHRLVYFAYGHNQMYILRFLTYMLLGKQSLIACKLASRTIAL